MRELRKEELVNVSGGFDDTLTLPAVTTYGTRPSSGGSTGGGYSGAGPSGPVAPPADTVPDTPELELPDNFENHCPDASPDERFIGLDVDYHDDGSITVTAEVNGFFDSINASGVALSDGIQQSGEASLGPADGPRHFSLEDIEAIGGVAALEGSLSTFTKDGAIS